MITSGYGVTLSDRAPTAKPSFRFVDLPGELRIDIYLKYFGSWDAVIEYDRTAAKFRIGGIPMYDIVLTNRSMHMECNPLIPKAFSGHLILKNINVRRERGFGCASSLDVVESLCPPWLLQRIQTLSIEQGTTSMLTKLPWSRLKMLREIYLEGHGLPVAHFYPCGLSSGAMAAQEQHVFDGRYDTWWVHGYNKWSCVPEPIANGDVRVMTVKQGRVKGARLRVIIEHKPEDVEVLHRSVDYVTEQGKIETEVSKDNERANMDCRTM